MLRASDLIACKSVACGLRAGMGGSQGTAWAPRFCSRTATSVQMFLISQASKIFGEREHVAPTPVGSPTADPNPGERDDRHQGPRRSVAARRACDGGAG